MTQIADLEERVRQLETHVDNLRRSDEWNNRIRHGAIQIITAKHAADVAKQKYEEALDSLDRKFLAWYTIYGETSDG